MYGMKVLLLSMLRRWIFFLAANDEGKYFFIEPFIKVSATLKIAIFPYLRFQRFQIDMLESFL